VAGSSQGLAGCRVPAGYTTATRGSGCRIWCVHHRNIHTPAGPQPLPVPRSRGLVFPAFGLWLRWTLSCPSLGGRSRASHDICAKHHRLLTGFTSRLEDHLLKTLAIRCLPDSMLLLISVSNQERSKHMMYRVYIVDYGELSSRP
jgi:hypothetical protein